MREVVFYRMESGRCPVEEFLDSLNPKQAQKVVWVLQLVEELDLVPVQYFKKLVSSEEIWEVRIQVGNNIYRILGFLDGRAEKGTDLFILLSRPALLPIFDPPSNDRLYFANESCGSCQLPPLQRFADQLPLAYGYRTPHEFSVARCPFIVGNP